MSWGGVDLILRRPGEPDQEAVDRLYEYDVEEERSLHVVTDDERIWMTAVMLELEAFGEWECIEELKDEGQSWPWWVSLEHTARALIIELNPGSLTLKMPRQCRGDDDDWELWWGIVEHFGARNCVVYEPDDDTVIDPTIGSTAGRQRHFWF